jgi:hypothetical protein
LQERFGTGAAQQKLHRRRQVEKLELQLIVEQVLWRFLQRANVICTVRRKPKSGKPANLRAT